jgi:hypothetical protein
MGVCIRVAPAPPALIFPRRWSCLGIKLASLARTTFDPLAPQTVIFTGQFIETGPTVVFAVFLFLGTAFFLYIKARKGPGPYTFASVFGCICLGRLFCILPAHQLILSIV